MMQKRTEPNHITEEMWIAMEKDTISRQDFFQILEHTGSCTWCAERLATTMEQIEPKQDACPPAYLTQQMLERTRQLDIQAAVTVKKTSKQMQLLLYSLKVSAGVALSILLLVLTANFRNMEILQFERPGIVQSEINGEESHRDSSRKSVLDMVNQAACGATEKMNEFANQLINGGKK